jgi:Apea-like HEPN
MAGKRYYHSWLGSGILLTAEMPVADDITLRPLSIEGRVDALRDRANSQFEYGLLCSIAPKVTFELITSGNSADEAAAKSWNNQYALIFLSIVLRSFVYHSIQVSGGYRAESNQPLAVSYSHGIPRLNDEPKVAPAEDLLRWADLLPNFTKLLQNDRFLFAASIAGTAYVHPNASVQVASIFSAIEALIDVDQELRFRISMTIAKLLANGPEERQELFRKLKKLYDGRSKCVHGGGLTREKIIECRDGSLEILRQLIVCFVTRNDLPNRQKLEEFLIT